MTECRGKTLINNTNYPWIKALYLWIGIIYGWCAKSTNFVGIYSHLVLDSVSQTHHTRSCIASFSSLEESAVAREQTNR